MCGFATFFEKGRVFPERLLKAVDADLFHRGPDSGGLFEETGGAMVFRRLAILDPTSGADQPMQDESGRYVLVFNGEIYNFPELKASLEAKGATFKTNSDTEAVLLGFRHWGPSVVEKLDGMFAFVIWDKQEHKAYAARDTLGIKPLYMARKDNFTGFSSEMRPLRRIVGTEVDPDAITEIMAMRYPTERRSNLKDIHMIPGGTLVTYDLNSNDVKEHVFENILDTLKPDYNITYEDALQITEDAVVDSVKRHLQSDVGYSVQLSGGVDSSLTTAIASELSGSRLRTYGIKLEDPKHDESEYRQMVKDRYDIDHHEIELTGRDFADGLADTCRALETPTAHKGCVFLKRLSQEIAKHDKVTLVGEGADEFFGGYERYIKIDHTRKMAMVAAATPDAVLKSVPRLHNARRYKTLDPALVVQTYHDQNVALSLFPNAHLNVGTQARIAGISDMRERVMAADQLSYLGSLLWRQDKISMAHSVEVRTPFAHMPLARAVNKIPASIRIPGDITKPLLKKVAEKWLPHELLYRRKVGLTLPVNEWINDDKILKPYVMALTSSDCALSSYADTELLKNFVEDYYAGKITKPTHQKILPILAITNIWLETLKQDQIEHSLAA